MEYSLHSQHVSVVIQGPIFDGSSNVAEEAIRSVREYLPYAEIILSTQDDQVPVFFEGVIVVREKAMLPFLDVNGNYNNVNKLISSVVAGLRLATRKFSIKLRTDHVLTGDAIIDCIRSIECEKKEADFFTRRIGVSNLFLRNPCKVPYLFHLTDTVQFGRTEDLLKLWSIDPLADDFVYLKSGPRINPVGTFQGYTSFRLLPEQAIVLGFLQKNGLVFDLDHISHTSFYLFDAWERILLENFKVHNWESLGILPPGRFLTAPYSPKSVLTEKDMARLEIGCSGTSKMLRYSYLLINKYLLCWFRRRWLVSVLSLLLFSFFPKSAAAVRDTYRKFTGARRL